MTADDVRARFEASYSRRYPNAQTWMFDKDAAGTYYHEHTHMQWLGYHAAHADLSVEVRELVETGNRSIAAFEALGKAFGVIATARARHECEAALVAQKAALAKFPHQQEKP